jgi:hypothetical protein
MAQWAPEETDTFDALAREIVQNAGSARTAIGVDGEDGTDLERVASGLVRGIEREGIPAMSAEGETADVEELRRDLVEPFRETGEGPGILVAFGYGMLAQPVRPLWKWTLWVERDGGVAVREDAKVHASAVIDATDPDHPRRNWADAC